jgi:hypothetical protein
MVKTFRKKELEFSKKVVSLHSVQHDPLNKPIDTSSSATTRQSPIHHVMQTGIPTAREGGGWRVERRELVVLDGCLAPLILAGQKFLQHM